MTSSVAKSGPWRIVRCDADIQWIIGKAWKDQKTGAWSKNIRPCAYIVNEWAIPMWLTDPGSGVCRSDQEELLRQWGRFVQKRGNGNGAA